MPLRHVALAAALAVVLPACATNPVTGQRELALMSEEQEIQLGRETDAEIRKTMGLYDDPALQRYVQEIGLRLAKTSERPHLPWSFAVVDSPAINAFAVPGGFIYLTRGILPFLDSEAEVAGVLGHEIGHVTARHTVAQYSRQAAAGLGLGVLGIFVPQVQKAAPFAEAGLGVLFLKYGRDDERQADQLGVRYTAANGWDPAGVTGMLSTLVRLDEATGSNRGVPNWLSTHPAPADRVEEAQAFIATARAEHPSADTVNKPAYLQQVDGIVFGDDPDKGLVRDGVFLHRALRFGVRFPQGWPLANTDENVTAKAPDANHFVVLELAPAGGGSLEQIARTQMSEAGFALVEGGGARIGPGPDGGPGLDAFVGTYAGTVEGLGQTGARAAHIRHGDRVYLVVGLAPAGQFNGVLPVFNQTLGSFRPLSAGEAAAIKANRVAIHTARAGDTWPSLASRGGDGALKPATLAIMNHYAPSQPPRAGDRLKIVVVGS